MIDFTSSLYLGMKHSSGELRGWTQLTSGVPSALYAAKGAKQISKQVALLQGFEKGFVAPSTLHLYYDMFTWLAKKNVVIFIDEKVYPVSTYGIEKLYLNRIPVHKFKHLDAGHLGELIKLRTETRQIPVVITDGWCPQCGKPAPLNVYAAMLCAYAGKIILDDTQGIGIFGTVKNKRFFGTGGKGILKWLNVENAGVICITSLAKAFGVPVAVISGSTKFIDEFELNSKTMLYSSPVNIADIRAACNALNINQYEGDRRREKLLRNILLARQGFKKAGINVSGAIFPVQSVYFIDLKEAASISESLCRQGIRTLLTASHYGQPAVTFIINCEHTEKDIDQLIACMQKALADFRKRLC